MRVIKVGVVEGLALALVDRPGIAVPEAGELRGRPRHFLALAGRRVEHRAQFAAAARRSR